ncbi:MAG: hypothetical protein K6E22_09200 [Treponema sp.]|nr:hypothetical protein [Treponema sp.]
MNKFARLVFAGVFFLFTLTMTDGCATTPEGQLPGDQALSVQEGDSETKKSGSDSSEKKSSDSQSQDSKSADSTSTDSADNLQEEEENVAAVDIKGRPSSDLKVPQTVEQYKLSKVVRVSPDVVQAVYKNTETKGKVLTVTKAYGNLVPQVMIPNYTSKNISYSGENLKGLYVVLGRENSLCRSASWVSGDFAFSVMADEGFTYENLDSFIQQIY